MRSRTARVVSIDRVSAVSNALEEHLKLCPACAAEYRVATLVQTALDSAAAPATFVPDGDFFKSVRARIVRDERSGVGVQRAKDLFDEGWAAALLATARQLIPVMAVLLLLIIGATLLWRTSPQLTPEGPTASNQVPRLFEDPAPSADDALDTFVAIEDRNNGK